MCSLCIISINMEMKQHILAHTRNRDGTQTHHHNHTLSN